MVSYSITGVSVVSAATGFSPDFLDSVITELILSSECRVTVLFCVFCVDVVIGSILSPDISAPFLICASLHVLICVISYVYINARLN